MVIHVSLHFLDCFFVLVSRCCHLWSLFLFLNSIQGTEDDVVDFSHGKQLWELCKHKYEPLWLKGGNHCNLELYPEYLIHLRKFISAVEKLQCSQDDIQESEDKLENLVSSSGHMKEKPRRSIDKREKSRLSSDSESRSSIDKRERSRRSLDFPVKPSTSIDQPQKARNSFDRLDEISQDFYADTSSYSVISCCFKL